MRLQRVDGAAHAGCLLPHGDIDADHVAVALGDHRVDGQRRLAGGMVADDQLALAPAKRKQRVHHEYPGLHRLGHEIAFDNRWRRALDRPALFGLDRALAVQRAAKRIDDPPEQRVADRHAHHFARAEDGIARLDLGRGVNEHAANQIGVQNPCEPELAALKPQNLVQPHVAQARDHRHTVPDLFDTAAVFGSRTQGRAMHCALRRGEPVRRVRRHSRPPSGYSQDRPASCCAARNARCAVPVRRSGSGSVTRRKLGVPPNASFTACSISALSASPGLSR